MFLGENIVPNDASFAAEILEQVHCIVHGFAAKHGHINSI
jgi:hypothetical protein